MHNPARTSIYSIRWDARPNPTPREIGEALGSRIKRLRRRMLFLRDGAGRRPVFGDNHRLQKDPHFRDYISFPDTVTSTPDVASAPHQTGWTNRDTYRLGSRSNADTRASLLEFRDFLGTY
jgi:hypothetical protein